MKLEQKIELLPKIVEHFSESELKKWNDNTAKNFEKYPFFQALSRSIDNAIAIFCIKYSLVKTKKERNKSIRLVTYIGVWENIFAELKRTKQMKFENSEYYSTFLTDPIGGKKAKLNKLQLQAASRIF